MNIRKHVKTFAAASLFALTIMSIPVVHAQAKPLSGTHNAGDPVVCIFIDSDGVAGVRNVGETYTDKNGHVFFCGTDGWFHQLVGTIARPSLPIGIPQSAGSTSTP